MPHRTASPLKFHGGKWYLAKRIVQLFPPHQHYVEPYFGGGAVLLATDGSGVSEVVNDIHSRLTNFWWVLQAATPFAEFVRLVEATPFSEQEYTDAVELLEWECHNPQPCVRCAHAFFVRCRQSLAGRQKSFTSITRTRTRRGINNEVSAWLSAIAGLAAVHARLQRVLILNRDALDVIRQQDGEQTLFYIDPPYVPSTRTAPQVYDYEMSVEQHHALLKLLLKCQGKVMVSGYRCDLYDDLLSQWRREDIQIANHSAGGQRKRNMTESLWLNY